MRLCLEERNLFLEYHWQNLELSWALNREKTCFLIVSTKKERSCDQVNAADRLWWHRRLILDEYRRTSIASMFKLVGNCELIFAIEQNAKVTFVKFPMRERGNLTLKLEKLTINCKCHRKTVMANVKTLNGRDHSYLKCAASIFRTIAQFTRRQCSTDKSLRQWWWNNGGVCLQPLLRNENLITICFSP